MNKQLCVLIAGAGIGGLTAALALLKRGYEVRVCEQAPDLREVGAGLQLSPNALRALYQLDLGEALLEISAQPAGKQVRLWNTGQSWTLFDLGTTCIERYGYPYLTVFRPDLQKLLVDAVRAASPKAVILGAQCAGFEQTDRGVTLCLSDGRKLHGDILIGADGVHSRIREQLAGADQPSFSGCIAWRGVIPMERLSPNISRTLGTNWLGPGAHVIHYPLRGGALMNFVGIVEHGNWKIESWTQKGAPEECHADFKGWHEDVHEMIRNLDVAYKWALMVREPMKRWSSGRVTLLGDACHPTLPFLAQGAAMAVEDGYIIGRSIEAHEDDLALALDQYEMARIGRTTRIVQRSNESGRLFHNSTLASVDAAAAYVDREWAPARVTERYDWLFRYNVDEVQL